MIDRLICEIRENEWGDLHAIADLRGVPATGRPQAELWMGAHPGAPSVLASSGIPLDVAVAARPAEMLGDASAVASGKLPFLFKVLAAAKALSIQVHPTKPQAMDGYERENAAGIGLSSPLRTYRDDSHKPELVVALSPFRALCGFRPLVETISLIGSVDIPEIEPLLDRIRVASAFTAGASRAVPDAAIIEEVVGWILNLPAAAVAPVVDALASAADCLPVQYNWIPEVDEAFPGDVGVLVGLFLNFIELQPGEAIFMGAGNVHSYLSGLAVEIMANSDNVVRAGLTPKNIDVVELMSIASFEPISAPIQKPSGPAHVYESPVPEFLLERIDPAAGSRHVVSGPEIVLATDGSITLGSSTGPAVELKSGESAFISAEEGHYVVSGHGLAWRATVGD